MILNLLRRFRRDTSGNFAITFGITIFPILFLAGLAVDYSAIARERSRLQESADSAAFYAVKELEKAGYTESDLEKEATKVVASNFDISDEFSVELDKSGNRVTVRLAGQYQPTFLALLHPEPVDIGVVAEVAYKEAYQGAKCFISLSDTGKGVLNLNGNAVISAKYCSVQVNSNSADAVDLNGAGTSLTSESNCFVGGVQSGLSRIQPPPEKECAFVPDPFDDREMPAIGGCTEYDFKVNGNLSKELEPGVYCGGISIGSGASVTFKPGLYVIKDGMFKTTGNASLFGDGVTFLFTGTDVALQFSGGTTFHFVAMKDGPLPGFVVFFDPAADTHFASSFSGNSGTYFEGILYFSVNDLSIDGEGSVNSASPFSALVANTITLNGNANIHFNIEPGYDELPVPEELYNKVIEPYLVR